MGMRRRGCLHLGRLGVLIAELGLHFRYFLSNLPFCCCSWARQLSVLMGCDGVSGEVNNQCSGKKRWRYRGPSPLTWPGDEVQRPSFAEKETTHSALCFAFKISMDFYPLMTGRSAHSHFKLAYQKRIFWFLNNHFKIQLKL